MLVALSLNVNEIENVLWIKECCGRMMKKQKDYGSQRLY